MDIQKEFYNAIQNNDIDNVKSLLKNENIDPSKDKNWAIQEASRNGHVDIVKLLLKDKKVKNTLKKDIPDLYNQFILKEKVEGF